MNTTVRVLVERHSTGSSRRYDRRVSAMRPSTSATGLDLAFAGGTADLRAVYDAHGSLVYSMCRKVLGDEHAKDVTQEVFVSAWRGRDQFDPRRGTLSAWLAGIAKRRIIDHLRREGRHADRRADDRTDDSAAHTAHGDPPTPERVVDRMIVADALRILPARTREVIELAYVHDLTHPDIAERTGLPLGTVKSDIRRGLLRIRDHLESTNG